MTQGDTKPRKRVALSICPRPVICLNMVPSAKKLWVLILAAVAVSAVIGGLALWRGPTVPAPILQAPPCPFITASSPATLSTSTPVHTLSPCPGIVAGTYLGGKYLDWANDVAVDPSGNAYVTGWTNSSDFPTTSSAYDTTWNGDEDAFIAKLDSSGGLVHSTFLGGGSHDEGQSVALDAAGNVYLAGWTSSCDFPTTPGAYVAAYDGCGGAFVAKFDPSGALVYSILLGGAVAASISVDASGNAFVAGVTWSPDFPTTPGAYVSRIPSGDSPDVFVAKLNPEGTTLVFSAIIGGENTEEVNGGAIDSSGAFYATGYTYSNIFPVTEGALDTHFDGTSDAFVFKLNPAGSDLVYSTYLGGTSDDYAEPIAVDSNGVAHIVGLTNSADFPRTPDAINTTENGRGTFVVGLDSSGALRYSALLGNAAGFAISVDDIGQIYLTGKTEWDSFLTTPGTFDATFNGERDAFVVKLAPDGTAFEYASYLGGGDEFLYTDIPDGYDKSICSLFCGDIGYSVFFDRTGNATVVGTTSSFDFPVPAGAYDATFNGLLDAFIIRMELIPEPNRAPVAHFNMAYPPDNDARVDTDAKNSADAEDRDELLEVRWDWEDDGVWDTDWSAVKTASHAYAASGTYTIRLEVRDTSGLAGDTIRQVDREGLPSQISQWANMSAATRPTERYHHGMAYDSESDRIIIYGGLRSPYYLDDTWSYDFTTNTWTNLDPSTHPSARYAHMMAYDSESDRIILFGGRAADTWLADTWAYDFNSNMWTDMNPTAQPSPLYDAAMAYDVDSDRVILFGGFTSTRRSDETWAYDFNANTWTNMSPAARPSPRYQAAMAYDIESDRVILFGGNVRDSVDNVADDTWAYDFDANSWVARNPPKKPSAQVGHAMAYDSESNRIVLHGHDGSYPAILASTWLYDFDSDTWVGAASSTSAPLLWFHAMAYDLESDRVILFGGEPRGPPSDETWAYFHDYTSSTQPAVAIFSPQEGATLRSAIVTVTGTASDDVAVVKVEVSAGGTIWELASGTTSWSAVLTLAEGGNTIYVRATDTSGNTATTTVTVTVQSPPPPGPNVVALGLTGGAVLGIAASGVVLYLRHRSRGRRRGE